MNRTRMLVLAVVSLALSGAVALVAYRMLEARVNPTARMGRVVVAVNKLPVGARITEADVSSIAWPANAALQGGIADPQQVVGRGVLSAVVPGEPILEGKLAPKEAGVGISVAIPEGMRAVAVKVDDVIGVAGFVLPGSRVDVILVGSPVERFGTDTSKVILQNVQVLTAGTQSETDAKGTPQNVPVVTLLVSPEDAQKLALASVDGKIRLALRNPLDAVQQDPTAVKRATIFTGEASDASKPPPPRSAAPKPKPTPTPKINVELIQGSKRETWSFDEKPPEEQEPER